MFIEMLKDGYSTGIQCGIQLQMSAPPDRISELLHSMQSCISDVKAWATVNMLRLNDSKT